MPEKKYKGRPCILRPKKKLRLVGTNDQRHMEEGALVLGEKRYRGQSSDTANWKSFTHPEAELESSKCEADQGQQWKSGRGGSELSCSSRLADSGKEKRFGSIGKYTLLYFRARHFNGWSEAMGRLGETGQGKSGDTPEEVP